MKPAKERWQCSHFSPAKTFNRSARENWITTERKLADWLSKTNRDHNSTIKHS